MLSDSLESSAHRPLSALSGQWPAVAGFVHRGVEGVSPATSVFGASEVGNIMTKGRGFA